MARLVQLRAWIEAMRDPLTAVRLDRHGALIEHAVRPGRIRVEHGMLSPGRYPRHARSKGSALEFRGEGDATGPVVDGELPDPLPPFEAPVCFEHTLQEFRFGLHARVRRERSLEPLTGA